MPALSVVLPRSEPQRYYLGADPGETGGIAVITSDGSWVFCEKMPTTAKRLLDMLRNVVSELPIAAAAIERIDPRPTGYKDKSGKWMQSILRSTCIIYGDFLQLHMGLLAVDIEPEIVGPKEWQKEFGMKREKGQTKTAYKRDLKELAQFLFDDVQVTLATADSLLIAEYCRRKDLGHGGLL